MRTAPGVSIRALLEGLPPEQLSKWVGPRMVAMIRALDQSADIGDALRNAALRMADPATNLRDVSKLSLIVSFLPIEKAQELAQHLGVPPGPQIYDDLEAAVALKVNEGVVRSFFGAVDQRTAEQAPPTAQCISANYGLFPHQRLAARRVVQALEEVPYKVLLHMPTGSGKTRTAMHIACEHLTHRTGSVVVWLAASRELLEQAADEFQKAWACLGNREVQLVRYWGSHEYVFESQKDAFVVAGLAKLNAMAQRAPTQLLVLADATSLTIFDEAHQSIAPTYRSVVSVLHTKRLRSALLGLSATPGRTWADISQDAALAAFFDNRKVTLEVEGFDNPVAYLIAEGYLARAQFRVLESTFTLAPASPEADGAEFSDQLLEQVGNDIERNVLILREIKALLARHRRVIVFAASVSSAQTLAAMLNISGIAADAITGDTDPAERDRAIRRYKGNAAEPRILCNYGVLTTGFDAPATSAALIARPTKSLVLYSQMVGRATRGTRAGGNENAEIVTVVDPELPGFGSVAEAFFNWEDVWK